MTSTKRNILTALLLMATTVLMAQNHEKMIVHLNDGTKVEYAMSQVEYVELVTPESSESTTPAQGVEGTIAEAVDLGLSVLWAEHNLGASDPTDLGGRYAFSATEMDAWGDGWRLPTDKEWQELYDKCDWQWTIRDGIGGRYIKGTTGKAMFIPAAGVSLDNEVMINGCVGIYWTADNATSNRYNAEAIGAYFDSANIYRMEYPKTNAFSVRLVKDR